ncbi:MAG: formyl transferase [Bacteroidia bacterium]|nr:formyl transferase [Bacteroidia bacterium]
MHKVVIITGDALRHHYFVSELRKSLDVVGVIFETKTDQTQKFAPVAEEYDIASRHFRLRDVSEEKWFGGKINLSGINAQAVATGESNSLESFDYVRTLNPEFILLYGSSIIKNPLLEAYDGKIINLHLGLSPYYRGSGTNFWPLVNGEPECVGATIHLATLKVDAGDILRQIRPETAPGDGPHDIGNKTIIRAIEEIPSVVEAYAAKKILPQKQNLTTGKVYRKKDLTTAAIETLYENFSSGMIEQYFPEQYQRQEKYPIIH